MEDFLNCIDIIKNAAEESNIMVIGVGGGGGNAVKYMYDHGIHNVMFTICNTDAQALSKNPVPQKMQLGSDLTRGRGAGNRPERGRAAALESKDDIRKLLSETEVEMVFITAGMGGGTGTGAAPVIAEIAKELEILSVAIVTLPFRSEGPTRLSQAVEGIKEIRKHVDSLLIIDNESINTMYGDLSFTAAFGKSDDVLSTAAKGIAEIVTKNLIVNVDFADVKETMSNSGVAVMGFATAEIDDDTIVSRLTEEALESPLLNQNNISGAQKILVKVAWKDVELKMNVVHGIIAHIQAAAGSQASLIWGAGYDETLDDGHASVVVIATCFDSDVADSVSRSLLGSTEDKQQTVAVKTPEKSEIVEKVKNIVSLEDETVEEVKAPVAEEEFVIVSNGEVQHNSNSEKVNDSKIIIANDSINILSLDDEPEEVKEEVKEEDDDFVLTPSSESISSFTISTQEPVSTTSTSSEPTQATREYTAEELEQMPAYIRRRYILGNKTVLKK
ncbi:MAG: cell division protein FtsZ [Rikenellaceae bacterium]